MVYICKLSVRVVLINQDRGVSSNYEFYYEFNQKSFDCFLMSFFSIIPANTSNVK